MRVPPRSPLPTLPRAAAFALILPLLAARVLPAAAEDPLLPLRGERVIVEFPPLEEVGRTRAVPAGWRYLQVTTATYDAFAVHLDPAEPLALLYFDEHGNLHLRDHSRERLVRLERSATEAEKRIAAWRRRLSRDWGASQEARRAGSAAKEVEILVALRDSGMRGAPELLEALSRLGEIEGERQAELWRALAAEGIVPRKELGAGLEALLARSRGLALEARIRAEIARVERGWVTTGRTPGGAGSG